LVVPKPEDPSLVDIPIIEVPSIPLPLDKGYRVALPGISGFEKDLDRFKPDIIHIHSPDTIAWAALKYAKKNNIPIVATHHTDFIRHLRYFNLGFTKPLAWYLLKKLYREIPLITTPSRATSKDLIDQGITGVQTIGWGVDIQKFNFQAKSSSWREKILGNKKYSILSVSRLSWPKDLKTLMRIYQILKKERDDFTVVIAGDGPARAEMERTMPDAVFLGHIEKGELSEVYASSDILLFPSSTETFGNVSIEAMSSGLVPVVANVGGSESVVQDRVTGLHAEAKNAEDFASKVNMLLDDEPLRSTLRTNGIAFAHENTWDKVFGRFLDIYKEYIKLPV
jgi:glycosyltransferase involved in cell wall biosynthesis